MPIGPLAVPPGVVLDRAAGVEAVMLRPSVADTVNVTVVSAVWAAVAGVTAIAVNIAVVTAMLA
jgi:hypothetical protein